MVNSKMCTFICGSAVSMALLGAVSPVNALPSDQMKVKKNLKGARRHGAPARERNLKKNNKRNGLSDNGASQISTLVGIVSVDDSAPAVNTKKGEKKRSGDSSIEELTGVAVTENKKLKKGRKHATTAAATVANVYTTAATTTTMGVVSESFNAPTFRPTEAIIETTTPGTTTPGTTTAAATTRIATTAFATTTSTTTTEAPATVAEAPAVDVSDIMTPETKSVEVEAEEAVETPEAVSTEVLTNADTQLSTGRRYVDWLSFTDDERAELNRVLKYNKASWDVPGSHKLEGWSYYDLYDDEKATLLKFGVTEDIWDCHINHYFGYWWEELVEYELDGFFTTLGWTKQAWNEGTPKPDTEGKFWNELTKEEKKAAEEICFNRHLWDGVPIPDWI